MWTFNSTTDHEVSCSSVGCIQKRLADGSWVPADSAARSKDCTGVIPAGQPHYLSEHQVPPARWCQFCVREMNDKCGASSANEPILVEVALAYSDGTIRFLDGEAADDWGRQCGATDMVAWAHGITREPLPWKFSKKEAP